MQIMNVDRYMKLLSNYDYFGTYDKFPVACNIYKRFEIQKNIQGMRFYTGNVDAPICAIYIYIPDIEDIIVTKSGECDIIKFICKGYEFKLYGCKIIH